MMFSVNFYGQSAPGSHRSANAAGTAGVTDFCAHAPGLRLQVAEVPATVTTRRVSSLLSTAAPSCLSPRRAGRLKPVLAGSPVDHMEALPCNGALSEGSVETKPRLSPSAPHWARGLREPPTPSPCQALPPERPGTHTTHGVPTRPWDALGVALLWTGSTRSLTGCDSRCKSLEPKPSL